MDLAEYSFSTVNNYRTKYNPEKIALALHQLIINDNLTIDNFLPDIGISPFFLIAATGLGKTVVIPVHLWLRKYSYALQTARKKEPRVWVVEPRVLIANEQASYMNSTFKKLLDGEERTIFGSITSKGITGRGAPIQFITTGVFSLKALGDDDSFDPEIDTILIDEAHETIAQNADVELAIAVCRKKGIDVSYMSATVDDASIPYLLHIDKQNIIIATNKRFPIYVSNVRKPMMDSIIDLIQELLIEKNVNSKHLPDRNDPIRKEILEGIYGGESRSHGLLIAINTVSGKSSDMNRVISLIKKSKLSYQGKDLPILKLSSEQTGNSEKMEEFTNKLSSIEQAKMPYVVIATSVIEMGVTIGTLDFVVTMDSGMANKVVGDRTIPVEEALPFNSLKQRLGRVGRRRPGVGLITTEVGANYTSLSDSELNKESLEYDPVKTPLGKSSLLQLAYYSFQNGWKTPDDVAKGLIELELPSRKDLITPDRLKVLVEERRFLRNIGIVDAAGTLTKNGQTLKSWLGSGYLPYAAELQKSIDKKSSPVEILFWTVALAASDISMESLLSPYTIPEELFGAGEKFAVDIKDLTSKSELVNIFDLISKLILYYGGYLDSTVHSLPFVNEAAQIHFSRQCEAIGMGAVQLKRLIDNIKNIINFSCKINKNEVDVLKQSYGVYEEDLKKPKIKSLAQVPWMFLRSDEKQRLESLTDRLPCRVHLGIEKEDNDDEANYFWILGKKRISMVGASIPQSIKNANPIFSARLQMKNEPDRGYWIDVVHSTLDMRG